jgi:hypothetical protein
VQSGRQPARPAAPPANVQQLLADGRLTVGLGLGTEDLGSVNIPQDPAQHRFERTMSLWGRQIRLDARFILTRDDFARALEDCEVLFVTSHSRFGAGPVFRSDGKALPFLMQQTRGYDIVMPDDEICGFSGTVKRRFFSREKDRFYTVFAPDGSDLEKVRPLHGYQLLVLSTCTSKKHFDDEIRRLRAGYPTTAVYTTRAACLDTGMNVFMRLMAEIFQGHKMPELVAALNQEYKAVAERNARKGAKAWKAVDGMYTLGFDTLEEGTRGQDGGARNKKTARR